MCRVSDHAHRGPGMRVVAALDKFRGTATAAEACAAVGSACWERGHDVDELPMSDGGEGLLEVLGGSNRTSRVAGPLGAPVEAAWRMAQRTAVIEMARASGLELAGGPDGNDVLQATTTGTGQLIDRALEEGARRIIVGLGGSATTDGGLGALDALRSPARLRTVELEVACDVRTRFVDAAAVFAPQKGASPAQVGLLTARLVRLAQRYADEYGVDVARPRWRRRRRWPRRGAGGGRWTAGPRVRAGGGARRARRSAGRGRRRRDRRGLPRRPEPRRQGRRRGLRAGRRRRRPRRDHRR